MPRYKTTFDTATLSMIANGDLSANQNYFVKLTGDGQVELCSAATDVVLGVLKNRPKANEEAAIAYRDGDIVNVVAGGAISINARVGTDADGKAIAKTANTDRVFGMALDAVSASQATAGAWVNVLIRHRP